MILKIFVFMSLIRLKNLQNGYTNSHEFQIHDCNRPDLSGATAVETHLTYLLQNRLLPFLTL